MRMYRLATLPVAAALVATGLLAPALAQSAGGGTGGPPPPGGTSYAHTIYSDITITGKPGGGGQGINVGQYTGPPCWIEPRFTGGNSWHKGDPIALTAGGDADEYWWWFGSVEPEFAPLSHNPGAAKLINDSFKKVQGDSGWWWVPAWITGNAGMACALGLVGQAGLNNGFLQFTPPGPPGDAQTGKINPLILREMARAAIILPRIHVQTNPRPSHNDVNLPLWVSVGYKGKRNPWAMASVHLPGGGSMWARVQASQPQVSLPSGIPNAKVYNHCGANGSKYDGDPTATPPCGVTFLAPSTGGPFPLTVTVRWTVQWRDSTPNQGFFPPAIKTRTDFITVREIQSINTNGNG